ncbi:MAG: cobalamin biosynthesis protein CobQ [Cyanobacteria bacterium P01_A01_bin.123]
MVAAFVKRYIIALDRYKWAGLAAVLAVFGASGVVALQPPPEQKYQADGLLVQNAPLVVLTETGTAIQEQGQGIITEDFLLADILLDQVSERLNEQGIELAPDEIKESTTISIGGDEEAGQRVAVRVVLDDPEKAELALSLMFEGMVEFSRFSNQARLRAIIEALNERLPQVESDLRQAEQNLERYDRVEGPAIQAALDGSLLGAISGSQTQRRQNEIGLEGIDAQIRSLEGRLGLNADQAYASSALSADPIIANLRAQIYDVESQMQILAADLRPAHPTMVELRQSLAAYENLLDARAGEVIGGGEAAPLPSGTAVRQDSNLDPARAALANQLVALQTQRDTLVQQQQTLERTEEELRQQYANLPNKQLQRERLAQQVGLKKALFDQLQARRIDAQAAEAETVSSLTVSRPPATTPAPRQVPNPFIVLALGGLLGVVAGGVIIFLLDMIDSTARTPEELQTILQDLEIPTLGVIPAIKTRSSKIPPLLLKLNSPYEENYERFRSNIRLASGTLEEGRAPRVVLITSTKPQEGKTVSAYNLAIASARAGRRTLLIEADLRSPSRASWLNMKLDRHITVEPLRHYGGKLGEPIQLVPDIENLYLCPSPGPQRQSAILLESSEMKRILEDARVRFDLVVIDAPPLTLNNDAKLLEPLTDGMIIITRPGVTEKSILSAVLEQLEEAEEVELLGAVINGADISVADTQSFESLAVDDDDDDFPPEPPSSSQARQVSVGRVDF